MGFRVERTVENSCLTKRGGAVVALTVLLWTATGHLGNGPLLAASITVIEADGNSVLDFSGPGTVEVDIDWYTNRSVLLEILLESDDTDSSLFFSGFHLNLTELPWPGFSFELEGGATWGEVNQVIPGTTGGLASSRFTSTRAHLRFTPGIEPFDVLVLGEPGGPIDFDLDWRIALNSLSPGDSFRLRLTPIPEPSSLALMSFGVAGAALGHILSRRHCRRDSND